MNAVVSLPYGGGLGNLLFYHHTAYAFSKKHNIPMYINCDYHYEKFQNIRMYENIFKHVSFIDRFHPIFQTQGVVYHEPNFFWNEIPFPFFTGTLFLQGYFQSYKYFWDYIPEIVNQLTQNLGESFMKDEYDYLSQGKKCTCVHIRRKDYLELSEIHTVLPEEYYAAALDQTSGRVLVFSDDSESIKDWKIWKQYDTEFVNEPDAVRALWLMYRCDSFVIANSSLSLNAYLFAKGTRDVKGVAPAQWFGPKGPQFKIDDIVPPGTLVLNHLTVFDIPSSNEVNTTS